MKRLVTLKYDDLVQHKNFKTKEEIRASLPKDANQSGIFADPSLSIQHWELWGLYYNDHSKIHTSGLLVAHGDNKCPVWKDKPGYKTETFIIPEDMMYEDIQYDIMTLLSRNGHQVVKTKSLSNGDLAVRAQASPEMML